MQSKYMASFISKLRLSMVSIDNYFRLRVTFSFFGPVAISSAITFWSLRKLVVALSPRQTTETYQ